MATPCAICNSEVNREHEDVHLHAFDCPRCGRWQTPLHPEQVSAKLGDWQLQSVGLRSELSHTIRRQQRDRGWVELPISLRGDLPFTGEPRSPRAQLDDLVLLTGAHQPRPGDYAPFDGRFVGAWIGSAISQWTFEESLVWLLGQINAQVLFEIRIEDPKIHLKLTFAGWERYSSLQHARVESRVVLMAMQFGELELTNAFNSFFKPAVRRTGFELKTINENQPAGLIDDQLRVALRTSRFIIADLTHKNNGAYWEAGFAEGLGRPVIYTCRHDEWQKRTSHFDTNHLVTVIWKPDDLVDAANRLTATIRATLPSEAIMTDPTGT